MGAFSPNRAVLMKKRDAFDPSMDTSDDDTSTGLSAGTPSTPAAASAISPTLQPASLDARSRTGGATGGAITPSHDPITSPRSQSEADLMNTEQKIAAFQPKKLGFWKGLASAYLPILQPHFTGEDQNNANLKKLPILNAMVNRERQQRIDARTQHTADIEDTLHQSQGNLADVRAKQLANPNVKFSRAIIEDQQGNAKAVDFNPQSGAYIDPDTGEAISGAKPFQKATPPPKLNEFDQFYQDYIKENKLPDSSRARLRARSEFAAAGQPPQRSPQQLAIGPDGKVIELKPGVQVPQGTKSVSGDLGSAKTTADEQRRADLAANLNENLDQLEEIAKRRPDLFGPMAGRMTSAKQFVGTSDPDVAALKVIQEQTGMAMVGAHAMRNAQHVETAANSIMNAYRNDPKAIIGPGGSIEKARASLKTFLEKQPVVGGTAAGGGGTSGAQSAPPPGAKIRDYTQLGH